MAGRADPPEETPENGAGGDDEYRALVFDESFVRAARLQEFSARERMGDHARAVRSLPRRATRRGRSAATLLVALIALAFAAAVYIGFRQPYIEPLPQRAAPLRATVVPLAPRGAVPGGVAADLVEAGPAAGFSTGADGINLPSVRRTQSFSTSQVTAALATAKDYLVESSLNPDVITGHEQRSVEALLDPDQSAQFERSQAAPADDGEHAATGWVVRFDPGEVELADPRIRVQGSLDYTETETGALEVLSDHTFTYVLRPAVNGPQQADGASLFTVRRQMRFMFDREDLRLHRLEVRTASVQAGPLSCADETADALHPLLAGERPDGRGPDGTDPYATGSTTADLCGTLKLRPPTA
ncbi:hypothetical protein [uncultured Streptomyces sp.]|uniref:SCO2583 family membrane protein n=1 Tax=uncultured Streptomyces sp. TaxID=174707 RepID=UPI00260A526B|nr:hypothetical protein [uncultured Streptomyces sp.]